MLECPLCRAAEESDPVRPFCPPYGSSGDRLYECECGQHWIQTNPAEHLWEECSPEKFAQSQEEFRVAEKIEM